MKALENGISQMNDINDHKGAKRLADIERRLDRLQADRERKDRPSQAALPEGMAAIMGRVATELVAGVIVGTFIGWMLDRWLDTSPLFLLVMFFPWCDRRYAECVACFYRSRTGGRLF